MVSPCNVIRLVICITVTKRALVYPIRPQKVGYGCKVLVIKTTVLSKGQIPPSRLPVLALSGAQTYLGNMSPKTYADVVD